jgi:hypothetical protein
LDGGQNPDVLFPQNPDGSGITPRDDKESNITKNSGHQEPVLKDARPQHCLRTKERDLRGDDSRVQERSSDNDCGLKDARSQHIFGTQESDLRGDSCLQELSSDHDCGLKDARAQHIFGTQGLDLRGNSRVHELSSDHNCGLKDASASHSVPKDASEPAMDGEGDAIGQKLHIEASRGIVDKKIQRVS